MSASHHASRHPRAKGSRKGYYADIDEVRAREEDATAAAGSPRRGPRPSLRFYAHVRPKGRRGRARRTDRAKIDLTLVSLLSSAEFDRPGAPTRDSAPSPAASQLTSSSSEASCGVSCGSLTDQANDEIIKTEKKDHALASSRPLAVIDYGSIQLDMAGSLLDSIYKIGGSGSGGGRSATDLLFGGRHFSLNDPSRQSGGGQYRGHKDVDARPTGTSARTSAPLPAFAVAGTASRKEAATARRTESCSAEGPVRKRQKLATCVDDVLPTTLDEAISFSPFARVLFCAQYPHVIVHGNAAYGILVQRGLAQPCVTGASFATAPPRPAETSEDYIARMAQEHMGSVNMEDDGKSAAKSGSSRTLSSGSVGRHNVHILPVMSHRDTVGPSTPSYDKCRWQLEEVPGPREPGSKGRAMRSVQELMSPVTGLDMCSQYISHYLLQIEPRSNPP